MKFFLFCCTLIAPSLLAIPLEYNNSAWYTGLDPHLVGKRENFLIQGVTVNAIQDASGFTGQFQAVLKFNYGGESPAIGNLSTMTPYDVSSDGVVSTLQASDLFFRESGVIRYGVPLVEHGGSGDLNGNPVGDGIFDEGDLYYISNGIQTMTSNQFLSSGTNPNYFGSGRAVWLTSTSAAPQALQPGMTQIQFNGACTDTFCPQAEYTVTINMSGEALEGSQWYGFLAGIADGSITPYFTGSACGNALLDPTPVPEPSTWALFSLGLLVFARRRRN